jgi:hypothetical protein
MGIDGETTVRAAPPWTPRHGALPWLLAFAVALTAGSLSVAAHERPERQRLVVSVERDRIELLIAYDLRPGALADRLLGAIDLDRDGRATRPVERLAEAQLLLPRVQRGIEVRVDGHARRLRVADYRFRQDLGEGLRRGIEGLVRLDAGPAFTDTGAPLAVDVRYRGPRELVLQLHTADGVAIDGADRSAVRVGPFVLRPGEISAFRLTPEHAEPLVRGAGL